MSSLAVTRPWPDHARVLLADEAGFSRITLAGVLADTPGVELVGVVADGWGLREALMRRRPDVLVIDDRLLRDAPWLPRHGRLRVVVIGVDDDPGYAARAKRMGAAAWIPKERDELLIEAITKGFAG